MIYYTDEQITIRQIKDSDVVYLFQWWTNTEINQFDPRPIPQTSHDLIKECENYCTRFDTEIINERNYQYFMIENKQGIPIGFVNVFSQNRERQDAEMGICMGDFRYLKQGIGTKAVQFVLSYLFEKTFLTSIYIETNQKNKPAINLFEKCGFRVLKEYFDEDCKIVVMEIKKLKDL